MGVKGKGVESMGRVEAKKKTKEETLYRKGLQLFVDRGFAKTTISDIAKSSGLAKGTFYLYFKDKYDLRDKLIVRESRSVLMQAWQSLEEHSVQGFEAKMFYLIDYIIRYLEKNTMILKFINKNLSWGIFEQALAETDPEQAMAVYNKLIGMMDEDKIVCEQPELMIFTIFELVSSSTYSCILNQRPVRMDEYMPYLHRTIHHIILAFTTQPDKAADSAN
jgi:AcrR family transcriptional regulator